MTREPADRWSMAQVRDFLAAGPSAPVPRRCRAPSRRRPPRRDPTPHPGARRRRSPPADRRAAAGADAPAPRPRAGWPLAGRAPCSWSWSLRRRGWRRLALGSDGRRRTAGDGEPAAELADASAGTAVVVAATRRRADAVDRRRHGDLHRRTTSPRSRPTRRRPGTQLTPAFQAAERQLSASTRASGTPSRAPDRARVEADPDSRRRSRYTVEYVRDDGSTTTDDVTLQLEGTDGDYLIAGESLTASRPLSLAPGGSMELAALYRDIVETSPGRRSGCSTSTVAPSTPTPRSRALYGVDEAEMADAHRLRLARRGRPRAVRRAPRASCARGGINADDVEVQFVRRDGTSLWVLVSESELRGPDGEHHRHPAPDQRLQRPARERSTTSRGSRRAARRGPADRPDRQLGVGPRRATRSTRLRRALRALRPRPATSFPAHVRRLPRDRAPRRPGRGRRGRRGRPRRRRRVRVRRPGPAASDDWVWTRGRGVSTADDDRPRWSHVGHPPGHHRDQARRAGARGPGRGRTRCMQAVAIAANEARTPRGGARRRPGTWCCSTTTGSAAAAFVPDRGRHRRRTALHLRRGPRGRRRRRRTSPRCELELANRAFHERALGVGRRAAHDRLPGLVRRRGAARSSRSPRRRRSTATR